MVNAFTLLDDGEGSVGFRYVFELYAGRDHARVTVHGYFSLSGEGVTGWGALGGCNRSRCRTAALHDCQGLWYHMITMVEGDDKHASSSGRCVLHHRYFSLFTFSACCILNSAAATLL